MGEVMIHKKLIEYAKEHNISYSYVFEKGEEYEQIVAYSHRVIPSLRATPKGYRIDYEINEYDTRTFLYDGFTKAFKKFKQIVESM